MKYCPTCGMENIDDAVFCKSCGVKIGVVPVANNQPVQKTPEQNMTIQSYAQPYPYALQHPSKSTKPIIAVAAIAVASIVVIALLFATGFLNDGLFDETSGSSDITKIPVTGGPTASLQSIATGGNALTVPAEEHTAVYGYYMGGSKIGSISFTNVGEETYNGELCTKIEGGGNFDLEVESYSFDMAFDIEGYQSVNDESLQYCNYDFNIGYGTMIMDMTGTVSVDKENNEITSTVYSSMTDEEISTVIKVDDDFWSYTNLQGDLYVGYYNEITYSTSVGGYDIDSTLTISVTAQEDITVVKGTFEDCYKVEIEQEVQGMTTTSYIWVDENNVCPKMQVSNSAAAMGYGDFVIELEEYYTT
jgi:hypothetical protein